MSITCARLSAAHNNSTKTAAVATQIFITGTPAARECERVRRCSLQKRLCILHATRVCRWAARSASRLQAVMNPSVYADPIYTAPKREHFARPPLTPNSKERLMDDDALFIVKPRRLAADDHHPLLT